MHSSRPFIFSLVSKFSSPSNIFNQVDLVCFLFYPDVSIQKTTDFHWNSERFLRVRKKNTLRLQQKQQRNLSRFALSRSFLKVTYPTTIMFILQEKACKWKTEFGMDGLTTNGVLIMRPRGGFQSDARPGVWREVSVGGNIYSLRETRSSQQKGKLVSHLKG